MSLPQAVIDQEREAEELHKKMYANPETEETPKEEPKVEEPKPEPKEEGTPTPTPEPVQPEAKVEAPALDVAEYERLKAAHSTLLGKYNAEVPRQADTIRSLEAKVHALEAKLAVTPQPSTPAPKVDEDLTGVYSQMENDFGKDFAKNFQKAVQAEARKIAAETVQGVRGEVESMGKTMASSREERFLADLTRIQPNWRTTFNDPRFVTMLSEVEPFTGKTLGALAQEANDAFDAARVGKVYEMFDKRFATPEPKVDDKPQTPAPKEKPNKEALVTPAPGQKATVASDEKADYIKADDIERFYVDQAIGKYADRPKEAKEMEARIARAISNRWVIG